MFLGHELRCIEKLKSAYGVWGKLFWNLGNNGCEKVKAKMRMGASFPLKLELLFSFFLEMN